MPTRKETDTEEESDWVSENWEYQLTQSTERRIERARQGDRKAALSLLTWVEGYLRKRMAVPDLVADWMADAIKSIRHGANPAVLIPRRKHGGQKKTFRDDLLAMSLIEKRISGLSWNAAIDESAKEFGMNFEAVEKVYKRKKDSIQYMVSIGGFDPPTD